MKNKKENTGLKRLAMAAFVLLLCVPIFAQTIQVSGKVTDNSLGEPMIGVSVLEKGTTNGMVTDLDGNYSLTVKEGATLVFSYVGYITQEVKVTSGTLNVVMQEDTELLDEVVVIGYGTTKAKNFTGSVDVIKMEDSPIADIGLSNASSLLRGRMSGVTLGAETGEVGKSTSILVRGRKSISSTNENPLIILNGVIFSGELDDIDPNSIESVSVLKDATSLAAYGSKAAQGVIMVTTKKGKEGKPQVTFSTSHEFSKPTFTPKFLDGAGYIRYRNARDGNPDLTSTDFMTLLEKQNYEAGRETDWYDLATRTGYTQNYNVSFSGASERSNYYIGLGHSDQRGMTVGNDFMRNYVTMNLSSKINKYIELGADMNFAYSKSDGTPANIGSTRMSPYGSAYLPDGRWRKYIDAQEMTAENPVWSTYNGVDRYSRRTNLKIGGFASIDIPHVEGLNLRVNGSYSVIDTRDMNFTHESNQPALLSNDIEGLGYSSEYYDLTKANGSVANGRTVNWVLDFILSYSRQFGDHSVSGSLVYTRDSMDSSNESYTGTGFTNAGNTVLGWHGLGNADTRTFTSPTYILHTNVGYLARGIYSYKDTYHLNASIRRDGSSVFGSDSKWGYFPAVGAAWTISNEPFMEPVKDWMDNLKLKLSWGKNGAQTIQPYNTLSQMSMAKTGGIGFFYGGNVHWGQSVSTLGNSQLGWQSTSSWNAGFETDLFSRRLHFELNFYKSKTTDQIFNRTIPIMTAGIPVQMATMGQVNNTGVEINATTVNIKNKDFTWTSDFVFTLNRNKLVDLYGDGKDDIQNKLFLGHPIGVIYGYETKGIFQEGDYAGWPIFYTKDGEQTPNPSPDDRKILGYTDPNWSLNWANTLNYKGFQLYMMLTGVFGGGGYALGENTFAYSSYHGMVHISSLDIPFWTQDNPNNTYPSPRYNDTSKYAVYNSYAHVRLQDISLSYNLTPWLKKLGITNAKIAIAGHNLFFIAPHWKLSDPDVRPAGNMLTAIGLPKSVTLSLNLSF